MKNKPHIFQSRHKDHPDKPRIWSVAGEGSESFQGMFFKKVDAELIVEDLILKSVGFERVYTQGNLGLE